MDKLKIVIYSTCQGRGLETFLMLHKKFVSQYTFVQTILNYSFLHFKDDGWLDCTDEYETIVESPEIVEQIFGKIGLIPKVKVIKMYFFIVFPFLCEIS